MKNRIFSGSYRAVCFGAAINYLSLPYAQVVSVCKLTKIHNMIIQLFVDVKRTNLNDVSKRCALKSLQNVTKTPNFPILSTYVGRCCGAMVFRQAVRVHSSRQRQQRAGGDGACAQPQERLVGKPRRGTTSAIQDCEAMVRFRRMKIF